MLKMKQGKKKRGGQKRRFINLYRWDMKAVEITEVDKVDREIAGFKE